jgi:hypothetical protein
MFGIAVGRYEKLVLSIHEKRASLVRIAPALEKNLACKELC